MPTNRNALIRYKTIDTCLRNRFRRWTLQDLLDACSEALYEYEGIDTGVSRRTLQQDIQTMRSEKLGYNAPIIVVDRKYYTYEDPTYSITQIPLTDHDLTRMSEAVEVLRQFKGFSHFQEFEGMIQRLEDKVHTSRTQHRPLIDLEKNELLRGLHYISPLYEAILNRRVVHITYRSFRAKHASQFMFHPHLLKEYRNRWFVLGKKEEEERFSILALDRIHDCASCEEPYREAPESDLSGYFDTIIGVTVHAHTPVNDVLLRINAMHTPYVLTKPLHQSQEVLEVTPKGITVRIRVRHNFELEREILGFGEGIQVLSPPSLKRKIKARLNQTLESYDGPTQSADDRLRVKLDRWGHFVQENLLRYKDVALMIEVLNTYLATQPETERHAIRRLLQRIPSFVELLQTPNLRRLIKYLGKDLFLVRAIFFDKPPSANWGVNWHQDKTIHVRSRREVAGFSGWTYKDDGWHVVPTDDILYDMITVRLHLDDTDADNGALQVIPGSHRDRLTDQQIQFLTHHSVPRLCELGRGGAHVLKPLLLHASSKSQNPNTHRRVIHLEFSSRETLPGGLEWAEKAALT